MSWLSKVVKGLPVEVRRALVNLLFALFGVVVGSGQAADVLSVLLAPSGL